MESILNNIFKLNNKKTIVKIIGIEIFLLVLTALFLRFKSDDRIYKEIDLSQCESDYINYNGQTWYIEPGQIEVNEDVCLFTTPLMHLDKGFYTLEVDYNATYVQNVIPKAKSGAVFVEADSFFLDNNLDIVCYTFEVEEDIDDFYVDVQYNGVGDYSVNGLKVFSSNCTQRMCWLKILMLFLAIDIIFLLYNVSNEHRSLIIEIIGITFLSSIPLFFSGLEGHDLTFHLMRIEGLAQELRNGQFPVRISSAWMGGYGYATSVFYGDLLLYFPAMLRLFGLTVVKAYKIYVVFINGLTTLVSLISFNGIFKSTKVATILTLVYMTSSYRLVDVFVRHAVGEYTASVFFPLIALSIWKIYTDNKGIKKNIINSILLAIGMTGIITAHVLSTEMVVVTLFVIVIILYKRLIDFDIIKTFLLAVVFTALLSAFFIVPFIDYYKNVPVLGTINVLSSNGFSAIQKNGASVADLFAFFNNPFGLSGYMLCTPGVILMASLIVALIMWGKGHTNNRLRILTICSILFLWISTDIFPWDSLAYKFSIFNIMTQVQFPWRYIFISIVILTLLLGEELHYINKLGNIVHIDIAFKIITLTAIITTLLFISFYADHEGRKIYYDLHNLKTYGTGGSEYLRAKKDGDSFIITNSDLFTGKFESDGESTIDVIYKNGTKCDFLCKNTSDKKSSIIAPYINYKGYVIYDEQGNYYDVKDSDNCLIQFSIPGGFEGILHIRFESPWYWNVATVVSLLSMIIIVAILFINGIQRKEKQVSLEN